MVEYTIVFSKRAEKHKKLLKKANLERKTKELLNRIQIDPYKPPFEALKGNLQGLYSRRINIQHRIVYKVYQEDKLIRVLSMWSHYEQ